MNLLSFNKCWPIGLDISTDNIRMLQLYRRYGKLCVRDARSWRIPAGLRSDPESFRAQAIDAVRGMLKRSNFSGRKVVLSLPSSKLHIKNFRIPQMSEDQLQQKVMEEAAERFDFAPSSDYLKYFIAGQIRSGNEIYNEVVVIAAEPWVVDEQVQWLQDMKLSIQHIDTEPMALFRTAERFLRRTADAEVITVLVDLGTSSSRIIIAKGRDIMFVKEIPIGGKDLNRAVANQLNLDITEARELRNRIRRQHSICLGGNRQTDKQKADDEVRSEVDWTIRDAVRSKIEELAHEIALCLRYCSVTFRNFRPELIQLTGGEAYDPAVTEILSEHLAINCSVLHPFRGFNVQGLPLDSTQITPLSEWAVAMGLASWNIDLYADRRAKRNAVRLSA